MRRSGYYWCLRGYIWDVLYFTGGEIGEWWQPYSRDVLSDDDIDQIDERRIVRVVE